jgi:tRNA nucleotidyltransferase/poly(A) polymerase
MRESILGCSRERVTEEVFKILTSGSAAGILELAHRLRLFEIIFPAHAKRMKETRMRLSDSPLGARLKELDERTEAGEPLDRGAMFGFLFSDLALERKDIVDDPDPEYLLQQFIRTVSEPLFPSKKDLAVAAQSIVASVHPQRHARATHPPVARGRMGATRQGGENSDVPLKRRRRRGRGRGRGRGGAGAAGNARVNL